MRVRAYKKIILQLQVSDSRNVTMPRLVYSCFFPLLELLLLLGVAHAQTPLSKEDKQEILDAHNRLRGMVDPPATNMERMVSS